MDGTNNFNSYPYSKENEEDLERDLDRVEKEVRNYEEDDLEAEKESELRDVVRSATSALSQVVNFPIVDTKKEMYPEGDTTPESDPVISKASIDFMITLNKRSLKALKKWRKLL